MHYARTKDIPVARDANGNQTRVLAGQFGHVAGVVQPAEPFDFLDVRLTGEWGYEVPSDRNVLVYVLAGEVEVKADGDKRALGTFEAVSVRTDKSGMLHLAVKSPAHVLVLSGTDPREPLAVYGPFIMNDEAQLAKAIERYRGGRMGRLAAID
jgi:redox-sensitive bicupin YhaK (pirin superfamily)